jgi:signal transduction histidine kinase
VSGSHPNAASWRIIASQADAVAFAGVRSTIATAATAVLMIAAMGSLLGFVAARRITARARALSAAAHRVANGDYSTPIVIRGNDELSDTARAFNAMTEELRRLIRNEENARNELSRLNIELVRSNGELENFARVTSHDLKSPLRALAVLPDWIEEDLPEFPDEVREHLDHMRQQAQRMTDLVDGLLRYSIAGTEASHPAPVDMRQLMRVITGTLGLGETFRVELDLPKGPIVAVRTELDVVIRNLVQNAIRHHDRKQGEIRVAVRDTRGALVISVSDDGPGIPEEYRAKVLEPLVTLVSRDESGGSGLGLAIVSKIARRWNGNVEILPREGGRGTLVRVTLNIQAPPAMAA